MELDVIFLYLNFVLSQFHSLLFLSSSVKSFCLKGSTQVGVLDIHDSLDGIDNVGISIYAPTILNLANVVVGQIIRQNVENRR